MRDARSRALACCLALCSGAHAVVQRSAALHDHSHRIVSYAQGLQLQERAVATHGRHSGARDQPADGEQRPMRDSLILLQHEAVLTLGTGSTTDNIVTRAEELPFEVVRTTRGGEVTYHGPGQLVAYPILDLRANHQPDLHWYLRTLEEVVIGALGEFGVQGTRIDGLTGVWVGERKLCAIGVKVSRWVTMHGFALNVRTDLADFRHIVPCGIRGRQVGSLHELVPDVQVPQVRDAVLEHFARQFGVEAWRPPSPGVEDAGSLQTSLLG
jgi:lipoyl(octanoyl) transferase